MAKKDVSQGKKRKSLPEKRTVVRGKLSSESEVASFEGHINGGPLTPYIQVQVDQWLNLRQAKVLVETLQAHITRLEVHTGADVTTGSHRLKKRPSATDTFIPYNGSALSGFVDDVQKLAHKRFNFLEHEYKWTIVEGDKAALHFNFEVWQASIKAKRKPKKER